MQPFQGMRVSHGGGAIFCFPHMIVAPGLASPAPESGGQAAFRLFWRARFMTFIRATILGSALAAALMALTQPAHSMTRAELDALVAAHAQANGLPVALVHRVIVRESRYNPGIVGKGGAMGLMQIKTATARGVGYSGSAADPETNLTYAVRYLAGAYRLAGGNHDRAVSYYARGYYYDAKRSGQTVQALARPGTQSFNLQPAVAASTPWRPTRNAIANRRSIG
jgi:soluble lytic murein transglycosylase-like protein